MEIFKQRPFGAWDSEQERRDWFEAIEAEQRENDKDSDPEISVENRNLSQAW